MFSHIGAEGLRGGRNRIGDVILALNATLKQ